MRTNVYKTNPKTSSPPELSQQLKPTGQQMVYFLVITINACREEGELLTLAGDSEPVLHHLYLLLLL